MELIIPGKPIAKERPRFSKRGTYSRQKDQERKVQWEIKKLLPIGLEPLEDCALALDLTFYIPYPKSWSEKKKKLEVFPITRPDCDNYVKFYLDSLNGIIYKDDNLIVEINATKIYSENPRTVIFIAKL